MHHIKQLDRFQNKRSLTPSEGLVLEFDEIVGPVGALFFNHAGELATDQGHSVGFRGPELGRVDWRSDFEILLKEMCPGEESEY